jgi:hypothetical protein
MAKSIAVDGRYAYTGQDIKLTLLETTVVDLTPCGRRLDNNDGKNDALAWMDEICVSGTGPGYANQQVAVRRGLVCKSSADDH